MKKIYINGDKYFKMKRPIGHSIVPGYGYCALWQPVKKFLCFWIPYGEKFYLDMMGFEEVNK